MVKVIYCIRRKPGMSQEEFHRYWREVHGPIAKKIPGLRRYVHEVWLDDIASLERLLGSPEYAAARADEANFIDLDRAVFMVTEEHAVIP
jgi:hypothetical protein